MSSEILKSSWKCGGIHFEDKIAKLQIYTLQSSERGEKLRLRFCSGTRIKLKWSEKMWNNDEARENYKLLWVKVLRFETLKYAPFNNRNWRHFSNGYPKYLYTICKCNSIHPIWFPFQVPFLTPSSQQNFHSWLPHSILVLVVHASRNWKFNLRNIYPFLSWKRGSDRNYL